MMLVLAIVEIFSVILQRIFCDSTLKKKKIRRYTDYLVWGGYFAVFNGVTYVLTYLGDGTSNIWLNILLFVCIDGDDYIYVYERHVCRIARVLRKRISGMDR